MSKNRKASTKKGAIITGILALVGVGLLAGSAIGNTNAALNILSDDYVREAEALHIGVQIQADGVECDDLVAGLIPEGEDIIPGKFYDRDYTVANIGTIDEYVRVTVRRYWEKEVVDDKGNVTKVKDTTLSPDLIDMGFQEGDWIIDPSYNNMAETTVLYYKDILPVGADTTAFAKGLKVSNIVEQDVTFETKYVKDEFGKTKKVTTYVYDYDGKTFHVEAEVDGVQTHNAVDAIKSSWGIDPIALGMNIDTSL